MKVYYDYKNDEIVTEEEATKYVKEEILDDDYALWEFITDNYYYGAIMSHLSQDFLKEIIEELIKNRLENPDYFLVREFPD
jgi:hypothetical protein